MGASTGRRRIAAIAGLALAACASEGGSLPPPATGVVIVATGALSLNAGNGTTVLGSATCPVGTSSAGVAVAALLASDQPGTCTYLLEGEEKANARSIEIAVVRVDLSNLTTSIAPGSYAVQSGASAEGTYALVSVVQRDASCGVSEVTAFAGTVTVISIDGSELEGTVDAQLTDGGTVIGSFGADLCSASFPGDVCAGSIGPSNAVCAP